MRAGDADSHGVGVSPDGGVDVAEVYQSLGPGLVETALAMVLVAVGMASPSGRLLAAGVES